MYLFIDDYDDIPNTHSSLSGYPFNLESPLTESIDCDAAGVNSAARDLSTVDIAPAERFVHRGENNVLASSLHLPARRIPKTSSIWRYGNGTEWIVTGTQKPYWRCGFYWRRKPPVLELCQITGDQPRLQPSVKEAPNRQEWTSSPAKIQRS
ncbi:hypothetical protein MMC32_003427 [Xylographa parallela]|nr:hypothetical protein [Xylographa parallela]